MTSSVANVTNKQRMETLFDAYLVIVVAAAWNSYE